MRDEILLTKPLAVVALLLLPTIASAHEGHHAESQEPMSVQSVAPGGAAAAAGVKAGDRLTKLAGRDVTTLGDLEQIMGTHEPGETVQLIVERAGEPVEMSLTFGEREGGRTSLGISLSVMQAAAPGARIEEGLGREECLAWIDETYRAEPLAADLDLDLATEIAAARACTAGDLAVMASPLPYGWCDNVFKVHCSGLDLLIEIGEAQIARCERSLSESLGTDLRREKAWTTCATDRLFDRYSRNGQAGDEATCRAILDDCKAGE